jgi:hypothetical protein
VLALLLATLLAGCVSVPTTGPVERIAGQPPGCTNCINVDVTPPQPGQDPKQIVEGFLRATSNFQPNYSVARSFLTSSAAERWSPEAGVMIYSGSPQATGNRVVLNGRLLGRLGPDRSYTPEDRPLTIDFGVIRVDGEWRINTPPRGLPVAEFAFDSFYRPYDVYFVSNGASLVPDPIYLPNLRNQAGLASVLVRALLNGPSDWLAPTVTSAIPAGTALSVDAVTISDGIVDIPLSDPVLRLNETQRTLMAAQVLSTLQPLGIRGVRFTVNQQPYAVPNADPDTFVLPVESTAAQLQPVPMVAADQLYAVRSRGVQAVNGAADMPDAKPMPGPLGAGRYRVDSLAVSYTATDLALVTDGRTVLRRAPTNGGRPTTLLSGMSGLLRPQFSRYGEVWAVGDRGGRQRLWVIGGDGAAEIKLPWLGRGRLTAFRVSPDGARLAAIRTVGGRSELGLARVVRSDKIVLDGWRPLRLNRSNTPRLNVLRDLSWADATDLVVLGGASDDVAILPYLVSQDAFKITPEGESTNWNAVGLTVSLRTRTGIIVGGDRQTWRDAGTQWVPYLDDVVAIAYPG